MADKNQSVQPKYNGIIARRPLSNGYNAYRAYYQRDPTNAYVNTSYRPSFCYINPRQWKISHQLRSKRNRKNMWMIQKNTLIVLNWAGTPWDDCLRWHNFTYPQNCSHDDGAMTAKKEVNPNETDDEPEAGKKLPPSSQPKTKQFNSYRLPKDNSMDLDELDSDNAALFNQQQRRQLEANWPEIYCTEDDKELADLRRQGLLSQHVEDPTAGDITLDDVAFLHDDIPDYNIKWASPKRRGRRPDRKTFEEPLVLSSNHFGDEELAMLLESCPDIDWILIDDSASSCGSWMELASRDYQSM